MTTGDYLAIAGLLGTFVALPGGIAIWMLKGMRGDIADVRDGLTKEVDDLEGRLRSVETDKVSRNDWIREQVSMAAKIDVVGREISALGGKFDASMGIGAGINRMSESVRELAERVTEAAEKKRHV